MGTKVRAGGEHPAYRMVWQGGPVPRFEPFRALRYAVPSPAAVVAPPYDVQSPAQTRTSAGKSPHNVVAVDVPVVVHEGAEDPYAVAADTLARWVTDGVLVADAEESFTIHRMRFTDDRGEERDLAAVVGLLEVVDEGAGGVLAHERTTPKASTDRLDLTRATRANLSPVWGLTLTSGLTELLREPGEVLARVEIDGVEHVSERLTDPSRVARIRELIARDEVLIADGHHRYAVARAFRDEERARTGREGTAAELTMAYVGELVPDQLSIRAIHRLYSGTDHAALRAALERDFEITDAPIPSLAMIGDLADKGVLALVGPDGSAEWLRPRPAAFDGVRSLDGAWLEHTLGGVEGLDVAYEADLGEVLEAVVSGRAHSAVLIRPVSIAEIERTGRERLLMPPKSTFFTPKPITGLYLRALDA
ncbi:MAG: DUF1015 domain-containing protein [Dermatophilaceae bacterium]